LEGGAAGISWKMQKCRTGKSGNSEKEFSMKHTLARFYPGAGKGDSLCSHCVRKDQECKGGHGAIVDYAEKMRR